MPISAANRLTKSVSTISGITTYTVDLAGNRTELKPPGASTSSFAFDAAGRMANADSLVATSYTYNALGQRTGKEGPGGPTTGTGFVYDRRDLMQETDGFGGDVDLTYAGATDEVYGDLISEEGTDGLIHLYDAMGSTVALADGSSGDILDRYKYTAFGELYAADIDGGGWAAPSGDAASATLAFGRKRYYADSESELFLLGAGGGKDDRGGNVSLAGRYYDPKVGRFVSDDPGRQSGGDINMQRYVGNDPVNRLDPSGQWEYWDRFKSEVASDTAAAYDATAAGINVGVNFVEQKAEAIWNTTVQVGQYVVQGIEKAEYEALSSALSAVGLNLDQLVQGVRSFTDDIEGTIKAFFKHGRQIWVAVNNGIVDGIGQFLGVNFDDPKLDAAQVFTAALTKVGTVLGEMFGVDDLVGKFKQFLADGKSVESAAQLGLSLVGYDWDSILGVVAEELGDYGPMAVGFVGSLIGEVADNGVWGGIQDLLHKGEDFAADAWSTVTASVKALPDKLWHAAVDKATRLIPEAVGKGLAKLSAELIPGGGWAAAVIQAIKFLYDERDKIREFFESAYNGFKVAVDAGKQLAAGQPLTGAESAVAGITSRELDSALRGAIEALLRLGGIEDLPKDVQEMLGEAKDVAQKPLRDVVHALASPVKKILAEFTGTGGAPATGAPGGGTHPDAAAGADPKIRNSAPPVLSDDKKSMLWVKQEGETLVVMKSGSASTSIASAPKGSALGKAWDVVREVGDRLQPAAERAASAQAEIGKATGDAIPAAKKAAKAAQKAVSPIAKEMSKAMAGYGVELKKLAATQGVNNAVRPGQVMTYKESVDRGATTDQLTGDHIPSFAALTKNVEDVLDAELENPQLRNLRDRATVMIVQSDMHKAGRTYAGKNTASQVATDAANLKKAAENDQNVYRAIAVKYGFKTADLEKSFNEINNMNGVVFAKLKTESSIMQFLS